MRCLVDVHAAQRRRGHLDPVGNARRRRCSARRDDVDLGLSWFVSLGDKSDVSANDLLQFWEDDRHTTVIGLYTETFGNPRKFARIARRVGRTKPIVAVRTGAACGRRARAARCTSRPGLIEVPTVQALLDTCRVLESQPVLRGPRIAVVTQLAEPGHAGVGCAPSAPASMPLASTRTDSTGVPPRRLRRAIGRAAGRPRRGRCHGHLRSPASRRSQASMGPTIDAAARGAAKPVVAVMIGSADGPVVAGSAVSRLRVPRAGRRRTLAHSFAYGRWLATESSHRSGRRLAPSTRDSRPNSSPRSSTPTARRCAHARRRAATDRRARRRRGGELLAATASTMARRRTSTPHDAVADTADRLGYPVAVKAPAPEPGRSAEAGIALDLADADDVARSGRHDASLAR